ncbi:MAG: peptidase M23, partial [Halothiobacillaceae bacterium]
LHYEFLVNGSHKDPLTVKLPSAPSLSKRLLNTFEKRTAELLAQLESYKQTKLALNTPNP